jgi:ParB-like chromosome segregation protein Spo0J
VVSLLAGGLRSVALTTTIMLNRKRKRYYASRQNPTETDPVLSLTPRAATSLLSKEEESERGEARLTRLTEDGPNAMQWRDNLLSVRRTRHVRTREGRTVSETRSPIEALG